MRVLYRSRIVLVSTLLVILAAGLASQGPDGEISGICWHDLNGDGVRDPAEPGLNGWTVVLLDPATHQVIETCRTRTVDLNGDGVKDPSSERGVYSFTDLAPGEYLLGQELRNNWRTTTQIERLFVLERSAELGQTCVGKRIFERNPVTGEVINILPLPDEYPPGEIAYGPGRIYYSQVTSVSDLTLQIWEIDPDTGGVIDLDVVPLGDDVNWGKYGTAYLGGKVYLLSGSSDPEAASSLVEWDPEIDEVTAVLPAPPMHPSVSLTGAADIHALLAVTSGIQGFAPANEVMKIDPETGQLIGTVAIDQRAYSIGYHDGQILVANYDLYPEAPFPHTSRLVAETGETVGHVPADPASFHHCDKWGFAGDGVKGIQRVTVEPSQTASVDFGLIVPGRGGERRGQRPPMP